MRKFQLLTATAIALMATTPAFAQETAPAATAAPAEEEDVVVVTATGRAQAAQDVPIAVSVVGAEQIENTGVSDIRGLRQVTPSLQDNPGFEPAVGVFIDGVFRARAGVALADLPPIDRVEVLRGPQGTLFGRNTSAGALSITTQGPSFDLGGYVEGAYGNYDEIEVKAGLTGGVTEQLALRVDGGYHKRDGYIIDPNTGRDFNNIDRWFVRGQAKFETTDVVFRLIGDYAETDEACCGALNTGSGFVVPPLNPNGTPNINNLLGRITSTLIEQFSGIPALGGAVGRDGIVRPFDPEGRRMATSPNRDLTERVKEWGVSGQLDWNLGDVTLTSITAYRDWRAVRSQDIDFSGLDRAYRDGYRTGIKDFTQELRLKGSAFDGKLDWLIGGFYLNEELTLTDVVRFGTQTDQFVDGVFSEVTRALSGGAAPRQLFGTLPGIPLAGPPLPRTPAGAGQQADRYTVDTQAFALFTHNIINITDNVSLTLGLRWNRETKDISANLNSSVPACSFWLNPASAPYRAALNAAGLFSLAHLYTCKST